jgi:hypothetical protein
VPPTSTPAKNGGWASVIGNRRRENDMRAVAAAISDVQKARRDQSAKV